MTCSRASGSTPIRVGEQLTAVALAGLAASSSANSTADVQTGVLAFIIVAAMGVALVFILRSMNKQFKKIGPGDKDMPQ
jgi:hypothetical protein